MSEQRNRRNRRRPESNRNDDFDKPEKIEYEIAKFLRSNLPQKQTTLLGHKVDYFIANRAIDLLMNSKWAQSDKRNDDQIMFPTRESCINFMNQMLRHQFFHRAKTIIVKKELIINSNTNTNNNNKKRLQDNNDNNSTDDGNNKTNDNKTTTTTTSSSSTKSSNSNNNKQNEQESITKKEKKKVKLDMHPEQLFVDSNEPYVWIYDYIPMRTWLIGGCLVIAAIAICLFPLWPRTVRNYVYYLSIAVAVFLLLIIALAVLKLVVFAIVWALTFGRHHFWILPNLTEDVGFFESFWPLYKHECKHNGSSSNSNKNGDDQQQQDDDNNQSSNKNNKVNQEEIIFNEKTNNGTNNKNQNNDEEEEEEEDEEQEDQEQDDNDSEIEQSNTNNSNKNNGFEMLDSNECQ